MSQEATAWAFRQKPRSAAEKLLLIGLAQFHSPGVEELAGEKLEVEYLASYALCSVRNVSRLLNSLQTQSYVRVERSKGTRNKYFLNFEKDESSEALIASQDNLSGVPNLPNTQEKLSTSDKMSDESQDIMSGEDLTGSDNMSLPTDNMADVIGQNVPSHRTNCPPTSSNSISSSNRAADDDANLAMQMDMDWQPSENLEQRMEIFKSPELRDYYAKEKIILLEKFQNWWITNKPTYRKNQAGWELAFLDHVERNFTMYGKPNKPANQPKGSNNGYSSNASTGTDQLQAAREAAQRKLDEQREREAGTYQATPC